MSSAMKPVLPPSGPQTPATSAPKPPAPHNLTAVTYGHQTHNSNVIPVTNQQQQSQQSQQQTQQQQQQQQPLQQTPPQPTTPVVVKATVPAATNRQFEEQQFRPQANGTTPETCVAKAPVSPAPVVAATPAPAPAQPAPAPAPAPALAEAAEPKVEPQIQNNRSPSLHEAVKEAVVPTAEEKPAEPIAVEKKEEAEKSPSSPNITPSRKPPPPPEKKKKKEPITNKNKSEDDREREDDNKKSKRVRVRTQPYQSPIPELALISKLSGATERPNEEKLIVFYKNEFLAVRNTEGGFYVCQAVQNVYRSSPRIRIRWLSQDKADKTYIPDFYDFTDFDCILTNINMERIEKGKYTLPKDELERTESILKRALDVESGASAPNLSEEHPDGLDVSLFRDESQLKKKRSRAAAKRKASPSPAKQPKRVSAPSPPKRAKKKRDRRGKSAPEPTARSERAKRRGDTVVPIVDQKKARALAKVVKAVSVRAPKKQPVKAVPPSPPASKRSVRSSVRKARK